MIPDVATLSILIILSIGFAWLFKLRQRSVTNGFFSGFFLGMFIALELYRDPLTASLFAVPLLDLALAYFLPVRKASDFANVIDEFPTGFVPFIKYVGIMFALGDNPLTAVVLGFGFTAVEIAWAVYATYRARKQKSAESTRFDNDDNPLIVRFTYLIDELSEGIGNMSRYVVMVTVFVGVANVVLRYVGEAIGQRLTSNVLIETQWYLYSVIFLLGFSYILKNQINVRVDFWFADQSPKRKAWIDFIGHLLALLPFCILALWAIWEPVIDSWGRLPSGAWGRWEVSPDPNGLARAPINTFMVVAFVTLFLQAVAELIKLGAVLRGVEAYFADVIPDTEVPLRIE